VPYSLATNDGNYIRGAAQTGDGLFDLLYGEGATQPKMMSAGIHLRLTGHAGRAVWLERFPRSRPGTARRLALQTDRHRATLDRAAPGLSADRVACTA
jgi:hypothetical protein